MKSYGVSRSTSASPATVWRVWSDPKTGPPMATFTFSCEIRPDGAGSTIAQQVAITGPLGFLFGAMMGNEMAKHFVPVLDDLARTAEAAQASRATQA